MEPIRRQWFRGGGLLAAGLCALAVAAPALTAVRESSFLERTTTRNHATASCYDRPDWAALVRGALKPREMMPTGRLSQHCALSAGSRAAWASSVRRGQDAAR
jgi:hypothetical protein